MDKNDNRKNYSLSTRLLYGKMQTQAWDYTHHVVPPITMSSTFRLNSPQRGAEGFSAIGQRYPDDPGEQTYVYGRMGEPNNDMLSDVLAEAEGKECAVTYATGMAAINAAVLFSLQATSEVISHKTVYGCTYSFFTNWMPRMGHKVTFCDLSNPKSFVEHVTDRTRLLYLESPANPTLELLDLEAIMAEVKKINASRGEDDKILTVMDNTFATPFGQNPAKYGVDLIVHSLTKALSGFGTVLGGAVVTDKKYKNGLTLFRKDFGGSLCPSTAWNILAHGVSTLSLRLPKQQANAMKVAEYLEAHPDVERVYYPGLKSFPQYDIAQRMLRDFNGNFAPGFMLYFTLKAEDGDASKVRGEKMMTYVADNAYAITLAVSLGQIRTLIEHPGSMTHASYSAEEQIKIGMHPGGIRLAIGIEEADDIIKDLDEALIATREFANT